MTKNEKIMVKLYRIEKVINAFEFTRYSYIVYKEWVFKWIDYCFKYDIDINKNFNCKINGKREYYKLLEELRKEIRKKYSNKKGVKSISIDGIDMRCLSSTDGGIFIAFWMDE